MLLAGRAMPLPLGQRGNPGREPEEPDEASGVGLIVDLILTEGRELLTVQAIRRLPAGRHAVPLVEFDAHLAGDCLLRHVDKGIERLTQRREPEAVVDKLGVLLSHDVLVVQRLAIQRDRFQLLVRGGKDRRTWLLVDPVALHPDEPILDEIDPADTVPAADLIQGTEQLDWTEHYAIEADRVALFEAEHDLDRTIGRRLRADR